MSGFELIRRFFGSEHGERRAVPRSGVPKEAHILVVDDSPTIRAVLGKMLGQDGHLVRKVGDGETAIEVARTGLPDLIFLDIVMPGMNGFAVLRALRRDPLTRDIPIVMISGNLQATEQFYVQRFGADDFMKKPFGRGEVFARIRHLTHSVRLVVRPRTGTPPLPTEPALTPDERAAIPDIAMPDPQDMVPPQAEESRAARWRGCRRDAAGFRICRPARCGRSRAWAEKFGLGSASHIDASICASMRTYPRGAPAAPPLQPGDPAWTD